MFDSRQVIIIYYRPYNYYYVGIEGGFLNGSGAIRYSKIAGKTKAKVNVKASKGPSS